MFERIVVPLDGSRLAEAVLSQVRRILFHKDAEILLVRAVAVPPALESDGVELLEILQAQAAKYLRGIADTLVSQGARARIQVRKGDAANVILDVASEERATLIAMSTHGRSGIARWAAGSVAEKVLRASRIPVLAIRSFSEAGTEAPPEELSLKRILVPLDAADLSLDAVAPVLELARLFGSRVDVLHVCEGPACMLPVAQMTRAHELLHEGGVIVEPLMRQGDPALQILEACKDRNADLIAMTTHGRSGVFRWMVGSVTEKVLRSSRVPLLIVRPKKAAGRGGVRSGGGMIPQAR